MGAQPAPSSPPPPPKASTPYGRKGTESRGETAEKTRHTRVVAFEHQRDSKGA